MLPPTFLDSSTGQYSSFETCCRFCFHYNNMNSSSSNPNNGFPNFNETNSILGFNSPPLVASRKPGAGAPGTSGSTLSRPRLLKVRKQTSSHNHKSSKPLDTRVARDDPGVGFDQFQSSSESVLGNLTSGNVAKEKFVFGANEATHSSSYWGLDKGVSSVNSNGILEDMSKLKINSDNDYANATENSAAYNLKESVVDRLMVDELPNDISKLKIEGASNTGSIKNSQGVDSIKTSQFTDLSNSNVEVELQNEMKRMNVKDPADISSESSFRSFGTASSTRRSEKMAAFAFTSKLDDIGAPHVEFKTPDMKSNIFSGLNGFNAKKESVKDTRSKKKKGKLKNPVVGQPRIREDFGFIGRDLSENLDNFEAYSPMDISPYDEKLIDNYSRETSVTSEEASQSNDQNNISSEPHIMTSNVTTDDEVFEPQMNEVSETESFKSATENLEYSSDTFVTTLDSDESSTATSGRQESDATRVFSFGSRSENISNGSFTFAASSSSQSQLPSDTRHCKNKLPIKFIRDTYGSTSADFFPISGNSIISPGKGQKVDISTSTSMKKDNLKLVNEQDFRHGTVINLSSSKLAEEACEKCRLRGNQAYSNGDLAKAEDCYTQGINSVSRDEKSKGCLRALMLCYSNRAATRISLGRMKEALGDCLMAATIDPNFLKVQIRAAHCYLAMGETENAKKQYKKCLQFGNNNSIDRKVIAEASEGLEKTQKVSDCIKQCTDLFQRRASEDLECALKVINEALQISTCSEKLLQMKAETLFMLRRYEQVIQVCEQTPTSDEADSTTGSSSMLWKPSLIIKSYFYLGRLDEALEFIKKRDILDRTTERCQESAIPLVDTIRELLSRKTAGNEAYKSGKHAEAVEHYTAALSCNVESRPFASVCFCNRAAAYSALGQIIDAIADCSLAIALDPKYLKAISRRASLYEMIRDYGQAAIDLQRLVSLVTTQVEGNTALAGAPDRLSCISELKQIQVQLSSVEEKSKKGIPLNVYIILGVESTASAADIKKAYRKAALRHHPDKAAQSLGRSDDGDDGLWKEIVENVHKDADRIFKMIGEAYAVLSSPSKRSQYDQDEERRNEPNRYTRSNSSRMAADVQNSVFERSGSRRQWQDSLRPNTQSTGSENTSSSYRYSRYY